jgi:hypothetical protein
LRTYLEKYSFQKRAGGVAEGVGPEFKPQYQKKKKKKERERTGIGKVYCVLGIIFSSRYI